MRLNLKMIFVLLWLLASTFVFAATSTKENDSKEVVMDTIHVNGMVLKGKITNIGSDKLSFRLVNIDGNNYIPYKDIDAIHSKYNYNIFYGDKKISGRVVGIVDQKSLKIESAGKTEVVKISEIDHFAMTVEDDSSVKNYVSNTLPYLSGNFSLGLELERGSSVQNETIIHAELLRKKGQNEVYFYFDYDYETKESSTSPKRVTTDEMTAILGDRYFYDPNNFLYISVMGEFDRPRNIDARFVPDAGYGHRFRLGKEKWIQTWVGLGHVWTRYVDESLYPDKKFTAAALGLNGKYKFDDVMLINRLTVDGEIAYYPSLSDPSVDWIMRSRIGLSVPIYEFISMKLVFRWINDSNPDPSIGNNKTKTNLMFGVDF